METVRWKLRAYLEAHNISAYSLGKEVGGMNTIYRLARAGQEPERIDLPTLGRVITGLRKLTGKEVGLEDIFEVLTEPTRELKSRKPGEESERQLSSSPPQGKTKPRGLGVKRIVPQGALVSTAIREARDERESKL